MSISPRSMRDASKWQDPMRKIRMFDSSMQGSIDDGASIGMHQEVKRLLRPTLMQAFLPLGYLRMARNSSGMPQTNTTEMLLLVCQSCSISMMTLSGAKLNSINLGSILIQMISKSLPPFVPRRGPPWSFPKPLVKTRCSTPVSTGPCTKELPSFRGRDQST